jgi:hypothetical protein
MKYAYGYQILTSRFYLKWGKKKLNKEPFEHKKNGNIEKEERRVGYSELCPKKWCLSIVYKLELLLQSIWWHKILTTRQQHKMQSLNFVEL